MVVLEPSAVISTAGSLLLFLCSSGLVPPAVVREYSWKFLTSAPSSWGEVRNMEAARHEHVSAGGRGGTRPEPRPAAPAPASPALCGGYAGAPRDRYGSPP
jgi:hypothetical protein